MTTEAMAAVVDALEAFVNNNGSGDCYSGGVPIQLMDALEAALPIARAQAEREREKDALIADLVACVQDVLDVRVSSGQLQVLAEAALDRARAAGVEVQQ